MHVELGEGVPVKSTVGRLRGMAYTVVAGVEVQSFFATDAIAGALQRAATRLPPIDDGLAIHQLTARHSTIARVGLLDLLGSIYLRLELIGQVLSPHRASDLRLDVGEALHFEGGLAVLRQLGCLESPLLLLLCTHDIMSVPSHMVFLLTGRPLLGRVQ